MNFRTILLDPTNVTLPACKQTPEPTITTCLALQHIAVNAGKTSVTCTTDSVDNCDTISCTVQLPNTTPVQYKLQVLPCKEDTPAIHVFVKRTSGDDNGAINQVLTGSKEVPVFQNMTLDVTLKQLDGAIGLQVDLLEDRKKIEELFSYSEIPINETQCAGGKMRADPVLKESPGPSGASPLQLIPWQLVLFSALTPLYSLL
ncbi:hypothetical protein GBAR_LOCUS13460 [Geodia barretti]|uniref:Uncharacterized protein n=2 Tax=Geodia barretti TaxID=519541 RepID=A0AA35S6B3_GEOBA|nr:hypothetical protein GBAR_LOCUS13460 [Geodia barretti]